MFLSFFSTSQEVVIPDANFKDYLLNNEKINVNGDSIISAREAKNYSDSISVQRMSIASLQGIEFFPNLKYLNCKHNKLTALNISKNKALPKVEFNNKSHK
jgi:hypothetical protein